MASDEKRRNIIIIGGGVIGCTSAYFITRHPSFNPALHTITIVEATAVASGASGKAGGLLALWAYPASIVPLSYRLHAELAAEHNGEQCWGYRKIHCGSLRIKGRPVVNDSAGNSSVPREESSKPPKRDEKAMTSLKAAGVPQDLDWFVPEGIVAYAVMGDTGATAQVHPYQFTTSMASLAEEKGAKIILGTVTAIDHTRNFVKGVTYEDKVSGTTHTLPATDVIVAAGPWSSRVFPQAPIEALRAHSVVIKATVSPYAVFTEVKLPANFRPPASTRSRSKRRKSKTVTPEIYARPNGEVYICGETDALLPLPKSTADVQVNETCCADLLAYVAHISDPLRDGDVLARQACYLPTVEGGDGPLIGFTNIKGLLLATGHTCWGIQNSAATGKLVSEFLWDGRAKSANADTLDPRKWL